MAFGREARMYDTPFNALRQIKLFSVLQCASGLAGRLECVTIGVIMPIVILPPDVVGKIAAGEVVERPASTAKELIENSLDAGASDIRVEIREGGRRLLRVIDDGGGIPRAEVELAVARHATSKLRTADDLLHITTLGFRGEALNSIAAVSQMTILTRSATEEIGTQLRVDGGLVVARESRGPPPGTVITVENLFFNVPARLAFLRQPQTEGGHIADMVARYAQAFPERRFSLVSDGRLLFQSTGSGALTDVLVKVHGLEAVSYTHLRAHETVLDLVCRLLLEKKNNTNDH